MDANDIIRQLRPYLDLDENPHGAELAGRTLIYLNLLLKWNAKINLTAVREAEAIVTRHFGESFFAARALVPAEWRGSVVDVGSGAGFPGLPLAMLAPGAQVTLIESNHKKAAFLNEVIFALKLKNAKVFSRRGEEFPDHVDLVTMRAVEKFESAAQVALGLVADSGRIALMVGSAQVDLAKKSLSNVDWEEPVKVPGGHSRVLLAGTKKVKVG